ncbi:hypothetical protein Syun_023181 [Stephania yunnanensis]|uniref:Uncharacterized protein n=1 Tax=Stephania yunnanensis TaxID=152371 RepID=A0AAP0F8F5_9MAGN
MIREQSGTNREQRREGEASARGRPGSSPTREQRREGEASTRGRPGSLPTRERRRHHPTDDRGAEARGGAMVRNTTGSKGVSAMKVPQLLDGDAGRPGRRCEDEHRREGRGRRWIRDDDEVEVQGMRGRRRRSSGATKRMTTTSDWRLEDDDWYE